jgi:hypothetical protein
MLIWVPQLGPRGEQAADLAGGQVDQVVFAGGHAIMIMPPGCRGELSTGAVSTPNGPVQQTLLQRRFGRARQT